MNFKKNQHKIWDNEQELIVTLTDVASEQELNERLSQVDQDILDRAFDTPFFAQPVEPRDDEPGIDHLTTTFDRWWQETVDWATQ